MNLAAGCDHTSKPSSKCILFEGRCLCTENIVFKAIDGNCPEQFEVEALILSQRKFKYINVHKYWGSLYK